MALRELLTGGQVSLTPAEEKIAQVLLNDWPGAGLGTASSLARRAGVSDPTVNRLVVKLGFEGFGGFQARLMGEVEDRLRSPLSMMDRRPGPGPAGPAAAYLGSAAAALNAATAASRQEVHDRAASLVMEARQVLLVGGRFSGFVAGILARHLEQFRPGVTLIETLSPRELDRLVDLGKRDLVVAFDFRRYQHDVVRFIAQAAATGARVVLFTDRWQSPATAHADVVFVSPVEVASPYDTMVPLLAQVEALVAQILATQGEALRARIERIEDVRRANRVTEDD